MATGYEQRLEDNLASVRAAMADAARRSGRQLRDVTLIGVTKYVDSAITESLARAGCLTLGESRPQSLWAKAASLQHLPIQWHMIGHLQRNKIRRSLPLLTCLHSVDSTRLLDSLDHEARRADHRLNVLLEVNISGDTEKTGLMPEAAMPLAERLDHWSALDICGLMAMSGRSSDAAQARGQFAELRELRDRMQRVCPDQIKLSQLSMGMSADYTIAIEEGATMVRVGSALFEGIRG